MKSGIFSTVPWTAMSRFQKIVLALAAVVFAAVFVFGVSWYGSIFVLPVAPVLFYLEYKIVPVVPTLTSRAMSLQRVKAQYPFRAIAGLMIFYFVTIWIGKFQSPDTLNQWKQVLAFRFDDWHPAAHTFLIWLVTCVCRRYWFFLLAQAAFHAFLTGLFWQTLVNNCKIRPVLAFWTAAFPALSPAIVSHLCVAWKDTAMMVLFFAVSIMMIRLAVSKGGWLRSRRHTILLGVTLAMGTLVRHNAFFFSIPLIFSLPFLIARQDRRNYWLLPVIFFAVCIPVKFIVIPSCCKSVRYNQKFIEAIGVPLGIMGYIYTTVGRGDKGAVLVSAASRSYIYTTVDRRELPPDFARFMSRLVSEANWQNYHLGDGINSVKWLDTLRFFNVLESTGPKDFFTLFIKIVRKYPRKSLSAAYWNNIWPWRPVTWPGCWVYLLLVTALVTFPWIKWRVVPFVLPTLCYQVGTTMLLCGGERRYFLYVVAITLPCVWAMLFLTWREANKAGRTAA